MHPVLIAFVESGVGRPRAHCTVFISMGIWSGHQPDRMQNPDIQSLDFTVLNKIQRMETLCKDLN
jgi:hypothetical protein